jgi:GNAT superfamily N-acetyltransferase
MEEVRPAGPDDLARCGSLVAAAREEAAGQRGGPQLLAGCDRTGALPTAEPDLAAWLSERGGRVLFVGTFEGAVVGVGAGHVEPGRGPDDDPLGVVDCCYVEAGARGVGVGSALAGELVRWFTDRGCAGVDAAALPGDRSTKQLYESAGLSARLLILHRRLP